MNTKKILLLALPLLAVCFASCEKDKGNDGDSVQKLVKSITYMESPDYPLVTTFEYDENGRVTCAKWTEAGNTFTIADVAYEGNMIIETGPGGKESNSSDGTTVSQLKEEYIHYLNDDGYVIKTEYKDYWSDETYNTTVSQTYEYENGKLAKVQSDGLVLYELQWQRDDIVNISQKYDINNTTESITYSNIVDKFNINILSLFGVGFSVRGTIDIWGTATGIDFKGMTSGHLPQMLDGEVYSYELDSDGYVTTIKVDGEPVYYIEYVE